MKNEIPVVDFTRKNGIIRRLNGGNLGPQMTRGNIDHGLAVTEFSELEIPITRLHDSPLGNPGMRLVDTQHIFGNFRADAQNPDNYYFIATDDHLRDIRAAGSEIFFRLGTSIEHTTNNYFAFPPQDYEKWADVCVNIIRHYNEGWNNGFSWNIIYWEIWNEPDRTKQMWNSSMEEYCRLYEVTAKKIKARFPNVKVGGPVLAYVRPGENDANARLFLEYCRSHQVPLDFFSWHRYASDIKEIAVEPTLVRELLDEYGFTETELHLNEWHYWVGGFSKPAYLDMVNGLPGINAAVFATAVISAWQDTPLTMGYHYTVGQLSGAWGAWDAWGERFKLFYTLKAFAKIARCKERVEAVSDDINVQLLAGIGPDGKRSVLISNFKSGNAELKIRLKGAENTRFRLVRIDLDHDWEESECTTDAQGVVNLPGAGEGLSSALLLQEA